MKHCATCECPQPTVLDQSKNGVRVIVNRWPDGSTTVDASCQCLGMRNRVHNNPYCKNIKHWCAECRHYCNTDCCDHWDKNGERIR